MSTVFALPERLSHKTAPELIAGDEQHFAAIAQSLSEAIADTTARLDAARRMPGRAGQAALDRDTAVRRLSSRLVALRRYRLDVCLGHIVPDGGGDPLYIGRIGLSGPDGVPLLIDWRSPAAEPYFAATHGHPLGLARRRRYRWRAGRIVDYWDEAFTPDALTHDAALDDQSAFIASLGAARSPHMRDVLSTIQADQDAIIRAGSQGALVVDGGPGTGKTVVALHRAAYLLYADPRVDRSRGGVLFVGPHQPYLDYVSDVLPALGEEGVRLCTLRDMVPGGGDVAADTDPRVAALKASPRFERAIDRAARYYEQPPTDRTVIETPWADLVVVAEDWAEAFAAPDAASTHNEARAEVREALIDILLDRHADDVAPHLLRRFLLRSAELQSAVARAWPLLDPVNVVADLWTSAAYLRVCAPWLAEEEVQLLQRAEPHAWTAADIPLLDAARHRIGDLDSARRMQHHAAALDAERERVERLVDELLETDDDGEGLVTMLRNEDLQEALVDEYALPRPDIDALAGPFAHVVVDEAQELTDAEWQMLLRRCPSRSFTIVGDRAQARHGFSSSWSERLGEVGMTRVELASLRTNYRTPEEIIAEAAPVILAALPDANVPTSIRRTGVPVRRGAVAERDRILAAWLDAHPDGTACVIGDQDFAARPRVASLSPQLAKGLEFDLVVLVDPDGLGDGIEGAVDRYVAMTRATRELVVLAG